MEDVIKLVSTLLGPTTVLADRNTGLQMMDTAVVRYVDFGG